MEIHEGDAPEHLAADLEELLAEHPDVGEQGLRVSAADGVVHVEGAVATEARRDAVRALIARGLPGWRVDDSLVVLADGLSAPEGSERLA
ncbi:MAG: BON domain-containing protein [Actinobacteria bacterium]|nr:BON domain-containing protein [Actinomycetota bacterium]